jgi:hypothetical protein
MRGVTWSIALWAMLTLASSAAAEEPKLAAPTSSATAEPSDAEASAQTSTRVATRGKNSEPRASKPWLKPGVLAASLAIVPGFVLHGAGSFAIGDRKTAKRLIISEGAGLATLVFAGWLIRETGTARAFIGALTPFAIAGFGLFAMSWLADIYAASTGGRDAYGTGFVPAVELTLGYLYVHDPQFSYGSFATLEGDMRAGAFRASPQAAIAMDDDNQRFLLELGYRAWGRNPRRAFADGSYLELATGVRYHRFGSERFAVVSSEWHIDGRLDLARMGHSLRGSFVEGQLGVALELYDFQVQGSRIENNAFGMLLARFGFGVYFGNGEKSGEALIYYDHRHDDFAAGFSVQGIGSGVLGHVGLRGRYFLAPSWGVTAMAELGAAVLGGAGVCYRFAGRGVGGKS